MKVKSLIAGVATAVIVPVAGFAGPALASSPGQIDSGTIYRVKNITKNSDFAASASATCGDEVQFKALLHNSGFGSVDNVTVKATLPSGGGTSALDVTYDSNGPENSVSASATLNVSSGSASYVSGSSQLLDEDSKIIKSLPDGITNGGVNTGTLNGSTSEFVTFKAKVTCETKPDCKTNPKLCPPPVTPPETPPSTPPTTPAAPTKLVNTGPGDVAAAFAVATAAGAMGYRLYLSRRLARQ
jgi:uncharacterized repeat protein (TIGR01451 family)